MTEGSFERHSAPVGRGTGSDGPPYRVAFTITADAAIDASRFMMASVRRWAFVLVAGLLASGVAIAVLVDWSSGLGPVVAAALILILTTIRTPDRWLINRRARSVIGGTGELTFGDTGVDFASPQASGHVPWSALTEIREGARSVLLVRDRIMAGYAPVGAFGSPDRRAEIID